MSGVNFRSLFDEDSFVKTLAFVRGDGAESGQSDRYFTGFGTISNRLIFAAVDCGDSNSVVHGLNFASKAVRTIEAAIQHKAPFILGLYGSYLDVLSGADLIGAYSELFFALKHASGKIPLICVAEGECLGINAAAAALCDFTFLCGTGSVLSAASDTAVNASSGRIETSDQLKFDSAYTADNSLIVSGICSDIDSLRSVLGDLFEYLPDSSASGAPYNNFAAVQTDDDQDIGSLKGRKLAGAICDKGRFMELSPSYGSEVATCFARIYGRTVGLICFDTEKTSGRVGIKSIDKIIKFTSFCASFRIPAVKLLDFTGLSVKDDDAMRFPGSVAKLISLSSERSRSVSVVTGQACGELAVAFLNKRLFDAGNISYAWKGSYIDAIDPKAAALMKYGDNIKNDPDPAKARSKYIDFYKNEHSSAVFAAESGIIDDIIDPSETRLRIASYLSIL